MTTAIEMMNERGKFESASVDTMRASIVKGLIAARDRIDERINALMAAADDRNGPEFSGLAMSDATIWVLDEDDSELFSGSHFQSQERN